MGPPTSRRLSGPASSAPAPRGSRRRRRCTSAGSPSTASRSPTASAATGCSKTRNGMSAAYRDLFINTSRPRMEYSDFPMPDSYPDFPHHTHIAAYFDDYVDHFGLPRADRLRDRRASTPRASRTASGRSTLDTGETRTYDALLVANGHHWDAALARTGVPRRRHVRRRSAARALLRRQLDLRRQARGRAGHGQLGHGHRRGEPPTWPSTPTWRRARASGSSPSTCSANRSTSCATIPASPSRSASA